MTPMRRVLLVAAVLSLVLRLFAAWAIPFAAGADDPNCAPDEAWHFWVAKDLSLGQAPTWPDESWSIYAVFPPSEYALHALTLRLAHLGGDGGWPYRFPVAEPSARGFPFARLGSVLLGVATVVFLASATRAWTGSVRAVAIAGLVAASYPQLIFIGGYTNADAYTIAAGAWLVLALSRWAVAGEGVAGAARLGLALGAVVIGKPSGYFTLPATAVWLAAAVWRGTLPARSLATLAGTAFLVAGPILGWNAIRNHGDVLGLGRYASFVAEHWRRSLPTDFADPVWAFATTLLRSGIGTAGNMDRPLPPLLIGIVAAMLGVGLVWSLRLLPRLAHVERRWTAWIAISVAINLALVIYNCWYVDFQPQGRYVVLSLVGLSIVAACAPAAYGGSRAARCWSVGSLVAILLAGLTMEAMLWRQPCAHDPLHGYARSNLPGPEPKTSEGLDERAPTAYFAAP